MESQRDHDNNTMIDSPISTRSDDDSAFAEMDQVSDDLRRKRAASHYAQQPPRTSSDHGGRTTTTASNHGNYTPVLAENEKISLALRTSALQTQVVARTSIEEHDASLDKANSNLSKTTIQQLSEIGRMRVLQQARKGDDDRDAMRRDGEVLDNLQERMTDFQSESNRYDEVCKEGKQKKRRSYKKRIIISILLVLIVVCLVVGLVVGLGGSGSAEGKGSASYYNFTECFTGTEDLFTDQYDRLRSSLVREFTNLSEAIDTPGSTARKSLCWLAHSDTFEIQFFDDLARRFIMGLLYYHFAEVDEPFQNNLTRSNWLSSLSVCEWLGTVCDGRNDISELHLNASGLIGLIPTELSRLTRLVHLDLGQNELSGSIPSELGTLSLLRTLRLGDLPEISGTIPSELGRLSALESLIVSGSLMGTVPSEVCLLRSSSLSVFEAPCGRVDCDCCTSCQ